MKTKLIALSLFAAASMTACNNTSTNNTETIDTTIKEPAMPVVENGSAPKMDSAAMMKAWMDYATPGDMHKWIASTDGTWSGEVQSWMDPAAPPTISTATATSKTMMGGRYQQTNFKGTMMGQPFEGLNTLAYDNAKKEFVSTWIDNMGTGIMVMKGKMDESTKTINFEGTMTDPATGKDSKMRQVAAFPDANTQTMEMYCEQDGKEMKTMAMKMTKK
jgi:hypothetical protein